MRLKSELVNRESQILVVMDLNRGLDSKLLALPKFLHRAKVIHSFSTMQLTTAGFHCHFVFASGFTFAFVSRGTLATALCERSDSYIASKYGRTVSCLCVGRQTSNCASCSASANQFHHHHRMVCSRCQCHYHTFHDRISVRTQAMPKSAAAICAFLSFFNGNYYATRVRLSTPQ